MSIWRTRRECNYLGESNPLRWLTGQKAATEFRRVAKLLANLFGRRSPQFETPKWSVSLTAHVYRHGPKPKPRSWSQRGYEVSERAKPSVSVHIDRLTDEQRAQISALSA